MAKLTVSVIPINSTPRNHPADKMKKVWLTLERHLKTEVAPMLIQDMEATVKNWKTKPNMVADISYPYGTRLQLTVQPKGRGTLNWQRISSGTGPRSISAKTPRGMAFRTGYTPKTTAKGSYGGPGSRHGPWRRKVMKVNNHRIEPREFSKKIMKRRERFIIRDVKVLVLWKTLGL